MKKPFTIASVLLLLALYAMSLSIQEKPDKNKLNDYWQHITEDTKVACGFVITKGGEILYENHIGIIGKKETNRNSKTEFRLASLLVFDLDFGFKIGIFMIKDNKKFTNDMKDLFAVKKPETPK